MKRETNWENIEAAARYMNSCIAPGQDNHLSAKSDFETYPDRVRYYTYPIGNQHRVYTRFIAHSSGLYLDYLGLRSDFYQDGIDALLHLAGKCSTIYPIYVLGTYFADRLREDVPLEKADGVLKDVFKGFRYTAHTPSWTDRYRVVTH